MQNATSASTSHRFPTDDGFIFYELFPAQSGSRAPTLTLLHNFLSTGRTAWGKMAEAFAQDFRVLLPDLPGHGRSQGYPAHFDHAAMGQQIAALMEAEGAQSGHLAGASSGGMVAQQMVAQGTVAPATLTLVSSSHTVDPQKLGEGAEPLKPENFRAGRNWIEATARLHDPHHERDADEGYFHQVLLPGFRDLTPKTAIDLPLEALRSWSLPVCLIHGEDDEFFPVAVAERMVDALPQAELHLIDNQSHTLIFASPSRVQKVMQRFLLGHQGSLS